MFKWSPKDWIFYKNVILSEARKSSILEQKMKIQQRNEHWITFFAIPVPLSRSCRGASSSYLCTHNGTGSSQGQYRYYINININESQVMSYFWIHVRIHWKLNREEFLPPPTWDVPLKSMRTITKRKSRYNTSSLTWGSNCTLDCSNNHSNQWS